MTGKTPRRASDTAAGGIGRAVPLHSVGQKFIAEPYGKQLEGLSCSLNTLQSADRTSAEGVI
ncbi:MAG: hypothetical protein K2H52_07060 [Lachnospiraceae bacterium]|nr:hypothetical protein [Lachnospiraceae bacterium]MDE6184028.1 hypothetical protein [Lachnospiraceae bacterium]